MAEVVCESEELPRSVVRRVVKNKLSQLSDGDVYINKEALTAFSESARIFIHYLSATANDICKESNRQIVNADDVLKALEDIEFPEFVGPLRASLEEFRRKNAKRSGGTTTKSKEVKKKKNEEPVVAEMTEENKQGDEDYNKDGEPMTEEEE